MARRFTLLLPDDPDSRGDAFVVAVTGATGHLGTVLVRKLVQRGETVRYITRGTRAPGLDGLDAEVVMGDLADRAVLSRAFAGADIVYHCAAFISILPGSWTELERINVEATRAVLEAARQAGVRRFVHVGSVEAFPLERRIRPVTEDQEIDPDNTAIEYGRSKALGVLEVLRQPRTGMECVVCCPTAFIGPPDYRRSPLGEVISDFISGKLPAYVNGGFDFVDVRDVADGLVRAGIHGKPGRTYLLSGRFASIREVMDLVETASGVRKPRMVVPRPVMMAFMPAIEFYYRVTGRPPQFTRGSLRLLSLDVTVDSSRARTELGYSARPLEETITDTVNWLRVSTAG
jgi:dihydroflavonol-4-reductase